MKGSVHSFFFITTFGLILINQNIKNTLRTYPGLTQAENQERLYFPHLFVFVSSVNKGKRNVKLLKSNRTTDSNT